MAELVFLCKTSEVPEEGQGKAFPAGDRMIAVFRQGDSFYALDDFCPHQGASLAEGWVHEGCVACPWHAWRFRLSDGTWMDNTRIKTDAFPVTIRGDDLYVTLP